MKVKRFAVILASAVIICAVAVIPFTKRVEQGEVGVVWTARNGVQEETLNPGLHFIAPLTKMKTYPISQQQLVLSNNPSDYNKSEHADWHVDAPANGGMVKMNLTVNYNFLADKVTSLYEKFNGMDGNAIVDNMVQNQIIAYIKEITPKFSVMDIYSTKRAEVSKAITDYLNEKLTPEYGIHISSALIIDVQLDDTLKEKIQAKEQAKQDAEKAELDRQTAIAQGEADKAKAEANAEVAKINAEAEAEKTRIEAKAQADANKMLSDSITDELIRMKEAEAHYKNGWITVQGADSVIADAE